MLSHVLGVGGGSDDRKGFVGLGVCTETRQYNVKT